MTMGFAVVFAFTAQQHSSLFPRRRLRARPLTGAHGELNLDGNAQSEFAVLTFRQAKPQKSARIIFGDGTANTHFVVGPNGTWDFMRLTGAGDIGFASAANFIPRAKFHTEFYNGTAFLLTRFGHSGERSLSTNDLDNASAGGRRALDGSSWLQGVNAASVALLIKNSNQFRQDRWSGSAAQTLRSALRWRSASILRQAT